jgi:hypothetical protein
MVIEHERWEEIKELGLVNVSRHTLKSVHYFAPTFLNGHGSYNLVLHQIGAIFYFYLKKRPCGLIIHIFSITSQSLFRSSVSAPFAPIK